jgi:hypothetical protein
LRSGKENLANIGKKPWRRFKNRAIVKVICVYTDSCPFCRIKVDERLEVREKKIYSSGDRIRNSTGVMPNAKKGMECAGLSLAP